MMFLSNAIVEIKQRKVAVCMGVEVSPISVNKHLLLFKPVE